MGKFDYKKLFIPAGIIGVIASLVSIVSFIKSGLIVANIDSVKSVIDDFTYVITTTFILNVVTISFLPIFQKFFLKFIKNQSGFIKFVIPIFLPILSPFFTLIGLVKKKIINKTRKKELTIASLMMQKKAKLNLFIYLIIVAASIIYTIATGYVKISSNPYVLIVLLSTILIIFCKQKVLEYRIEKGYFGTNEYEAREFIKFIMKYSRKYDNFNGMNLFPKTTSKDEFYKALLPNQGVVKI